MTQRKQRALAQALNDYTFWGGRAEDFFRRRMIARRDRLAVLQQSIDFLKAKATG